MKKIYTTGLLLIALFSANIGMAQVFKLHAEYRSDWYGNGYDMVEDIPGYPSVTLQAQLTEDQFVIESDFGQNRWRKYGTTGYDTAFPTVYYSLVVTDNYLSQTTKQDFYYTTRIKNVGYASTNFIVMQTEFEPVQFAASNPVVQSPTVHAVADFQPVVVTAELADVPSNEEKFFVRYSTDNFQSSQVIRLIFPGGAGTKNCGATIPGFAAGTTVTYYVFSSTVEADQGTLNNDYDLVTLHMSNNQGSNYQYTVAAALAKVTFRVNMSNVTPNSNGVYLVGNFNNYDTLAAQMNNVGNGIYEYEIFADTATTLYYKYLNGNSFANEEQVPAGCGVSNGFGGFNRYYDVPGSDSEIDTVCFSKCVNCASPSNVKIKFRLNMVNQTVSPNGVHIAGSFNNFDPTVDALTPVGNDIYEAFLFLDSTSTVTYKFINGNSFADEELVPGACGVPNGFGGYNRTLDVPEVNTDLPVVCFGVCSNCSASGSTKVKFIVNMSQEQIDSSGVHIAGTFNNFSTTSDSLTHIGNGIYEVLLNLDSTQVIEYKFINGSTFNEEEIVPAACGLSNGFGGYNRYLAVPEQTTVLDTVCFSSCSNCQSTGLANVTFVVDMSGYTISTDGVHLAGSFNGFNVGITPMNLLVSGGNIYAATLALDTTTTVQYKFINGNTFGAGIDETVPAACGVPNGFGGFNRSLNVPNADDTTDLVCFESCIAICGFGLQENQSLPAKFTAFVDEQANNLILNYESAELISSQLTLLNSEGKLVREMKLSSSKGSNRVDLAIADLAPGLYYLNLQTTQKSHSKKVLIVR